MANRLTKYQADALERLLRLPINIPITGKALANEIGLKPRSTGKEGADLRAIIHALRCKGYPICATGEGYFYARTPDELSKFITSFEFRVLSQQQALEGLKKSWENIDKRELAEEEKPVIVKI